MEWTCCGRDMRTCLWERFKLISSRPGLWGGCSHCLGGSGVLSLQRDKWFCGSVPRMQRIYCALENGTGQVLFQFRDRVDACCWLARNLRLDGYQLFHVERPLVRFLFHVKHL